MHAVRSIYEHFLFRMLLIIFSIIIFRHDPLWAQFESGLSPISPAVRKVMKKEYSASRDFSLGRAAVLYEGYWGFIDRMGEEVVPPQFDLVCDYWDIATMGRKGGQWYLISLSGTLIKEFSIDFFDGFRKGQAAIYRNGQMAFINTSGDILPPGWVVHHSARLGQPLSQNNLNFGCPSNFDF